MLFDISGAAVEKLDDELFNRQEVQVFVLRLDAIHPVISGNKLFKLHYFLEEALQSDHKTITTFGGAYSNHLAATAHACKLLQLKSRGIIRGEAPSILSHTLQQCLQDGMQLQFISREQYARKTAVTFGLAGANDAADSILIPEGGYHPLGARGSALIMQLFEPGDYTHICTASGTLTTAAGLLLAAPATQKIVSFPVLKGMTDYNHRIATLTGNSQPFDNLLICDGYHFGGYAKKDSRLIDFMNACWLTHGLALDFVYTAKMFYGVTESIRNGSFEKGSKILCIHSGGLQGNKSLPLNTLLF